MNSNQQKKPSINIPLDDEPKNITFQTKLFSPQAVERLMGHSYEGVIKTSPKNNNVFKKDDNRSFSPNTIRSKLNKDNNPITNYKYFIETFTKFSKKQTDNTITQFRQIDKPWTSLSKKQKNKLFKQMTLDIILTHQRDRDNLEIIKHEFSTRDLSITKITAKKWIENIHKKYQDEETTLIKDTKTKLNAWIAHVDEHKLKLIKVNHDITKHNNFKSKRLDVLSERGKKALIKKIQDLLKEKVEIEKQIQKGEKAINLSISLLESLTKNLVKNKNDLQKLELNIGKYLFKQQYLVRKKESIKLWNDFESGVITFMIFSKELFENEIIQNYLKTKKDESMKKWAEDFNKKIKAGGSIKRKKKLSRTVSGGKKKIRKHRGIVQSGGNKGKLKKGYKYTGKRLKNGLAEIKKVKAKK